MPSGIYQHKKGRTWKVKDTSKMSEVKKGYKNPMFGKKRPPHKKDCKCYICKSIRGELKGEKHYRWIDGRSYKKTLKYQETIAGKQKSEQCEICGGISKICFDHDHVSGKFRGWICTRCNLILGHAKDDIELLKKLIKYLKLWKRLL